MRRRPYRLRPLWGLWALGFFMAGPASAVTVPQGWISQEQAGFVSYSPAQEGQRVFMVVALEPLPMQGQAPAQWLEEKSLQLSQGYGSVAQQGQVKEQNAVWTVRHQLTAQGKDLAASYMLRPMADGRAKLVLWVTEEAQDLLQQHGQQTGQLLADLLADDTQATAPASERSADAGAATGSLAALSVEGATVGGDFTFGKYRCQVENGKHPYEVELQLYPNKEMRTSMRKRATGTFNYYPDKGTVNIDNSIHLFNFDNRGQARTVAVYFKDRNGKAYIRGQSLDRDRGTTCVHVGPSDAPSPSQEAARAEERRFKWVTAPGQGLALRDIETILHTAENVNDGLGIRLQEDHILLLKDGWAYTNLVVTPADLDVPASRQNEPQNWVRWKKQGNRYLLERGAGWVDAPGTPVRPARPDERLQGAYSSASFHGNAYTSGYTFKSTLYFKSDGSLEGGSAVRGGTTAMNSGTFSATVASDASDDTPVRYHLDGYTLERRHPNGQTSRSLFFFWGQDQQRININGTTFSK